MQVIRFLIAFMLSSTMALAYTPGEMKDEDQLLEDMMLNHVDQTELDQIKIKNALANTFDQQIEESEANNESLDESMSKLKTHFAQLEIKFQKLAANLLQGNRIKRLTKYMKKQNKNITEVDFKTSVRKLYSVDNVKKAMNEHLSILKNAGSHAEYLKILKGKALSSQNFIDWEGFFYTSVVILISLVVVGLPLWGAIVLFAVGASLEIIGGVVLVGVAIFFGYYAITFLIWIINPALYKQDSHSEWRNIICDSNQSIVRHNFSS